MPDIFSLLKDLTQNKKPYSKLNEEEIKTYNSFMINRFLSMNKDFIELVNYIQWIPYENKESYYKIYLDILPKRSLWLNYIKSKTKNINKGLSDVLTNYFECSSKELKDYIKFLSKEEIKEILQDQGIEDKEITKLMK